MRFTNSPRRLFTCVMAMVVFTLAALENVGAARAADGQKPLTEWYLADLVAIPIKAEGTRVAGSYGFSLEWIAVLNLGSEPATATVTCYFEDAPPADFTLHMPPGRTAVLSTTDTKQLAGKLFGARVKCATPVVVQEIRAEQEFGVQKPQMPGRSFLSHLGHPGPLGKAETLWTYCDAVVQVNNPNAREWEWMTVLNPNPGKPAKIKATFNSGKGTMTHEFTVDAERVRTVSLQEIPGLPEHAVMSVFVESDVPVVVEQIRRFSFKWHDAPAGTFLVTAMPIGDRGITIPTVKPAAPAKE